MSSKEIQSKKTDNKISFEEIQSKITTINNEIEATKDDKKAAKEKIKSLDDSLGNKKKYIS